MKQQLLTIWFILIFSVAASAQKAETFDIITFKTPVGWQKQIQQSAVQLGVDGAQGTCLMTMFKAVPGSKDSKANFTAAWDSIVKETVSVAGKPERQPATNENGWTAESGFAQYESDGKRGLVLLVTMTGNDKMVNILILTDTVAYQSDITSFLESVNLPKIKPSEVQSIENKVENVPTARKSNYQFTTTNFDDGWTAVEQEDWVRVTKGNIAVLVHYPNKQADAYNSVLRNELTNAWNILIAPRYSGMRNFELKPIQSWQSISFAEADAVENATGKNVHLVLFKKHFSNGNGKYLEFITNTKADFEREFGAYHNNEFGWDKLVNMQGKNSFAVSNNDLVGKWSTSDYASLSYYYVNSGGYAGATATSTADELNFFNGGNYQSDHAGASGVVGSQKFSRQVYKGKFSADNWTLTLTNRFQGATEKYNSRFEAIKGGRILILTDSRNSSLTLIKSLNSQTQN